MFQKSRGDGTELWSPVTACPSSWGVWRATDTTLIVNTEKFVSFFSS